MVFSVSDKNYFSTQISTSASFVSGFNLLTDILNSRRLIDIPQITFTQTKDSLLRNQINFVLPINILYWKN
jgi:hypothetical protein